MNEDHDWNQLEDTWKSDSPVLSGVSRVVASVKKDSRLAALRLWLVSGTACAIIAGLTLFSMLRRSVESYTFTVIAWSALFSFGSYLLASRQSASELGLQTTTALEKRSKTLARGAQLLDFGRSLVGVEVIICAGFWIALHRGAQSQLLPTMAIVLGGLSVYGSLSWILAKVRRELSGLMSIRGAMDTWDQSTSSITNGKSATS